MGLRKENENSNCFSSLIKEASATAEWTSRVEADATDRQWVSWEKADTSHSAASCSSPPMANSPRGHQSSWRLNSWTGHNTRTFGWLWDCRSAPGTENLLPPMVSHIVLARSEYITQTISCLHDGQGSKQIYPIWLLALGWIIPFQPESFHGSAVPSAPGETSLAVRPPGTDPSSALG